MKNSRLNIMAKFDAARMHDAIKGSRSKVMTVAAAFPGLPRIMLATFPGADVLNLIL